MPPKRTSPESTVNKLREAEILISLGDKEGETTKQIRVTGQTDYRWRKAYGGLALNKARRLKESERENARLKRLLADLSSDKSILCKRWEWNSMPFGLPTEIGSLEPPKIISRNPRLFLGDLSIQKPRS